MKDIKKTRIIMFLAVAALVVPTGVAFAAVDAPGEQAQAGLDTAPQADAAGQQVAQQELASGKIASVDQGLKLVKLNQDSGSPMEFTVDSSTQIKQNGQTADLAKLKEGQEASITYQKLADGKNMAKSIEFSAA
jgi:hypothetical protein